MRNLKILIDVTDKNLREEGCRGIKQYIKGELKRFKEFCFFFGARSVTFNFLGCKRKFKRKLNKKVVRKKFGKVVFNS